MQLLKKNLIFVLCISYALLLRAASPKSVIDLEDFAQDFVINAKQIHIPGFPGAFNPSIVRWQGSLLLSFRIRNAKLESTFQMGLVWLDEDFNTVSDPQILEIPEPLHSYKSQNQDPRIFVIDNQLYVLYSGFTEVGQFLTRRMFLGHVHYEKGKFFTENPLRLHPFEDWSNRLEKNWVPFIYHGHLLLSYSILPHRILYPFQNGECRTLYSTKSLIDWKWGELRGGTPALLDGNEFIAFFHSSLDMHSVHSQGKKIQHYVMGAYTFAAKPPFNITRISKDPIIGKNFYHGPEHPTWKPLRVVFPMGCIADEDYFWVTYGRQDFEVWVVKIDKKGLYSSLVSCPMDTTY